MISHESFQEVGQTMLNKSHSFTYYTFEYKVLEKQLTFLKKDLCVVNTEINELNDIINDLTSKYNLNTKFSSNTFSFIFPNVYGKTVFQIKKTATNFKKQLKNKENEKKILLLDIETTENLIIMCNKKLLESYN